MDSCWAKHYRVLANRFQGIIRGQYFGHTHNDEFFIVKSLIKDTESPGVLFTAPSLGTYERHNPSFRLYEYDYKTHHLVNIHQYRLPLYKANLNTQQTQFEKSFDFKTLYSMNDMSPSSFQKVADQVLNDSNFAQVYYAN